MDRPIETPLGSDGLSRWTKLTYPDGTEILCGENIAAEEELIAALTEQLKKEH